MTAAVALKVQYVKISHLSKFILKQVSISPEQLLSDANCSCCKLVSIISCDYTDRTGSSENQGIVRVYSASTGMFYRNGQLLAC